MPESDYVFVSDVPLQYGSEGQNDLLQHSGDPVPDRGGDSYLYERGISLGGNLIRHYKFDETSGSTANDETGTDNASIGSAVNLGATGKDGTAFTFTKNDIDSIVDNKEDNISYNQLSVAAWVNLSKKGESDGGVSGEGVQQVYEQENNVELFIDEDSTNGADLFRWRITDSSTDVNDAYSASTFDSWVHLVGTYDNGTREQVLYVDGSEADRTTLASTVTIDGGFVVGREYSDAEGDQRADGRIDDVRIYQVALTPEEVNTLYNIY